MENKLRINEIFYSLQGEGVFAGTPAVFVRLSGCNRACPFCDTDFAHFTEMSIDEVVAEVEKFPAKHVVFTGGEPTLQRYDDVCTVLKQRGYFIQIETNGSNKVSPLVDWVTCSPKDPPYNIDRIDELKIVYTGRDVEKLAEIFKDKGIKVRELQPCSGKNTAETIDYILKHPWWRLSLQTHKILDIR